MLFLALLVGFVATTFTTFCLLFSKKYHLSWSSDTALGPQKIHKSYVPRIGGLAWYSGFLFASFVVSQTQSFDDMPHLPMWLALSVLPVASAGFLEDVFKNVTPKIRLLSSIVTGGIFIALFDYSISELGIAYLDDLLAIVVVSNLVTVLSIATMINSINIIDGLNGLALSVGGLCFAAVSYFAWDAELMSLALVNAMFVGVIMGVLIFNFPKGRIFLGDGGAYIIGGLMAMSVITLSAQDKSISPFALLLIVFYPCYELFRTMARRFFVGGKQMMMPDNEHLHSLVYRWLDGLAITEGKWSVIQQNPNPFATGVIVTLPALSTAWAVYFRHNELLLIVGIFVVMFCYETLYKKLMVKVRESYT